MGCRKKNCKYCNQWLITQTLLRQLLFPKRRTSSRYTRKCTSTSKLRPEMPSVSRNSVSQLHYVAIFCAELYPNRARNVENMEKKIIHALGEVRLSLDEIHKIYNCQRYYKELVCAKFHPYH